MIPTKFRAWVITSPPGKPATVEVKTLRDVMIVLETLIALRTNLEDRNLPVWNVDVSGLEVFVPDAEEDLKWQEFYDADGEDIEHYWEMWTNPESKDDPVFDKKLTELVEEY